MKVYRCFSSLLSSDVHVSEKQAQALANYIRANGTMILRQARSLFLWTNLTQSILVNQLKYFSSNHSSVLVWSCSFRLLLCWFINECINICIGWINLFIYCTKNLSSLPSKSSRFCFRKRISCWFRCLLIVLQNKFSIKSIKFYRSTKTSSRIKNFVVFLFSRVTTSLPTKPKKA